MPFIDVHHHYFPCALLKEKKSQAQQLGWQTPAENLPWSPELSLRFMDASDVQFSLLSLPALATGTISDECRALAREHNTHMAAICQKYPHRFGFLACLPFLDDVEGVLTEIDYALDVLGADGISLSSSYGEGSHATYVGHDKYDSIWAELDTRQATVFIHGTQITSSSPYPHEFLGVPIVEVPNETFKAASHLAVSGRKRKYPNVKIILAHLGGSLPFLAARIALLSRYMGCPLTPDQLLDDFRDFYFETALGSYDPTLAAMETFIKADHLLYGTDFPAVSKETADWFTTQLETRYMHNDARLKAITKENAVRLFPRLQGLGM